MTTVLKKHRQACYICVQWRHCLASKSGNVRYDHICTRKNHVFRTSIEQVCSHHKLAVDAIHKGPMAWPGFGICCPLSLAPQLTVWHASQPYWAAGYRRVRNPQPAPLHPAAGERRPLISSEKYMPECGWDLSHHMVLQTSMMQRESCS